MSNVSAKSLFLSASVLLLAACGTVSPEQKAAQELLDRANTEITGGDPALAITLLDSISVAYPDQTEIRREALALRPKAVEAITLAQIEHEDSVLAALEADNIRTAPLMKKITGKDLVEPYFVPGKGYNPNFVSSTGIQARVDLVGQFYLLSSVNGKPLRHVAVEFTGRNGSVATKSVPADGETNFRMNGSELITYEPGGCDTIGQFFLDNRNTAIKGFFISENGRRTPFPLTADQIAAIGDAYSYSRSITEARTSAVRKEKLERQLQIARDQIARTATEKD